VIDLRSADNAFEPLCAISVAPVDGNVKKVCGPFSTILRAGRTLPTKFFIVWILAHRSDTPPRCRASVPTLRHGRFVRRDRARGVLVHHLACPGSQW